MKKPCKNCPFRRTNTWHYGAEGKILALKELDSQNIFSCHAKHPDRNIFSIKDMEHNDCIGFEMMKENHIIKNKHPQVVNCFNETGPEMLDLEYPPLVKEYKLNHSQYLFIH
jgi:hypothetical protein